MKEKLQIKTEKVYSLRKDIPQDIGLMYAKLIDERNLREELIKHNTDKWVEAQKKIIELQKMFEKLKDEKNE